jgi:hypothetical protein
MRTFEAWSRGRVVRSFNARDLAEAYKARMAAIGGNVEIKVSRIDRRAA